MGHPVSDLPKRLAKAESPRFIGRAHELRRLGTWFDQVRRNRRPELVAIDGPAGIGKSRLAAEFASGLSISGGIALVGRCDEHLHHPYQPWRELLQMLVNRPSLELLPRLDPHHRRSIAELLDLAEAPHSGPTVEPETARFLLFDALVAALEASALDEPMSVIIEDLQWSDEPSLQVLAHVLRTQRSLPVLFVATLRHEDADDPPVLTKLGHPLTEDRRLHIRGLDQNELLRFVEDAVGASLGAGGHALRDALMRETDGNPFFSGELVRHLVETGPPTIDADWAETVQRDLRDKGLPPTVRAIVERRVEMLGKKSAATLAAASVIGPSFDTELLAAVTGEPIDVVQHATAAAVEAAIVVPVSEGRHRFAHALIEHGLYDSLSRTRRALLHRKVAAVLERLEGDELTGRLEDLLYHSARAGPGYDQRKVILHTCRAGDRSLERLAPDDALRRYGQAVALLDALSIDDEALRGQLLVRVGEAERQVGDPHYRATLLEAARVALAQRDATTLAAAALANNRGFQSVTGSVDVERVEVEQQALDLIGPEDSAMRAQLLSLMALERTWDGDLYARWALSDQALAMARRLDDPATLLGVLLRRNNPIWAPESLDERGANAAEAEALAIALDDPVAELRSLAQSMSVAIERADTAGMARAHDRLSALTESIAQPSLRWYAIATSLSWYTLLAGDAARAEALAGECLQLGVDTLQPDAFLFYGVLIGAVRWHQGREHEIVDLALAALPDLEHPAMRAVAARILADLGRMDEARDLLRAAAATHFDSPPDMMTLAQLTSWAEAAARLNDRAAAESLYVRLLPWTDRIVLSGANVGGAVAHSLGLLAATLEHLDTADQHLAVALQLHERLGAPFHIARTRLELARICLDRSPPEARAHLEAARDLAAEHGCAAVHAQAAELLATIDG